jgi:hypothetical protein
VFGWLRLLGRSHPSKGLSRQVLMPEYCPTASPTWTISVIDRVTHFMV